ncbi:zinc finger protein 236-like [Condylostylus longicornis]|uniref:zinc finger protein 236-like n=1 Tax=Condylostylus longicornis TaxID=2530218 RepID=UPI00244DB361|nr:zinc finger protein 236-like [Condylostylus longicornis]
MDSLECTHCNKIFQNKSVLNRHLQSHLSLKPHQCKICDQRFTQKSSLERHQLTIHNKEKNFKCRKCNLKFSQKYNVEIHMQRAHLAKKKGVEKHSCPNCSCEFSKLNSLNRHISQIHTNFNKSTDSNNDSIGNLIEQLKMLQQNPINVGFDYMELQTVPEKLLSDSQEEVLNIRENCEVPKESQEKRKVIEKENLKTLLNFPCIECGRVFQRKFDLVRHIRIHRKIRPFSCTKCDKSFTLKCILDRHMKTHVEMERKIQCRFCDKKFISQVKLEKHNRIHILPKSYMCMLCAKTFKLKQNLESHQKLHEFNNIREEEIEKRLIPPIMITDNPLLENVEYKYSCTKCVLKFKSLAHLRYHEAKHIGIKKFKCNICERRFLTKSSLTCHQLVHNSIRQFKCQICLAKFKTASNLRNHLLIHSNTKSFLCAYCCKTFRRKMSCQKHLKTHIKDVLLESEPIFSEDNPNIKEVQSLSREVYVKSINDTALDTYDNLLHSCTICKKNFKKPNDLERHNRIHNKEKPYRCDKCDKSFTLKGTLNTHMKIHEENRIKVNCTVCGKYYATQSALQLHLRIHTGELPFKCEHCPKMFRTAGHKIAHSKQHLKKRK